MSILTVSVIVIVAILGGMFVLARYPKILDYLPMIRWGLRLVLDTMTFWEVNVKYRNATNLTLKYAILMEAVQLHKSNPRISRAWVAKFVKDSRDFLEDAKYTDAEAEKAANAISMLLTYHPTLFQTLDTLRDSTSIDVKGLTVIAIDVFGELFDLRDELDKSMFEHLVVGVNKSLVALRDKGYSTKAYNEVGFIMLRLRRVCATYNEQKLRAGGLSIGELHRRVDSAIADLNSALTWKPTRDK